MHFNFFCIVYSLQFYSHENKSIRLHEFVLTRSARGGYPRRGLTLRARSQPNLNRLSWVYTFWIENDIGYNILKNDKNSWNCWREFKGLLSRTRVFQSRFSWSVLEFLKKILNSRQQNSLHFQYVVVDIILYSKSLDSAETVKFWPGTSSQYGTPAGKPSDIFQTPKILHIFKVGIRWRKINQF